jgi:maleylpyruvate isomerase
MTSASESGPTSGPNPSWDPGDLSGVQSSSQAYTRTVDALTAEDLAAPSLLPGWTRAHVVAHVALNALALAGSLRGVVHGKAEPMYESDQQRDGDIDELAQADPSDLRERHLAATTEFADAVELMDEAHWDGWLDRLPGGPAWPAVVVVPTRRRELEIHHVDLGASYTRADWPEDFLVELLNAVTVDHGESGPFRVRATDLGRDWAVGGEGGPTVMGSGADVGWWLTGRGTGEGLATDSGALPQLGPWRRAASTPVP